MNSSLSFSVTDPAGARGIRSINFFFIFMQFWAKDMPNNRLASPFWLTTPTPSLTWKIMDPPLILEKDNLSTKKLWLFKDFGGCEAERRCRSNREFNQ